MSMSKFKQYSGLDRRSNVVKDGKMPAAYLRVSWRLLTCGHVTDDISKYDLFVSFSQYIYIYVDYITFAG